MTSSLVIRFPLLPDESLTSYLIRLAIANHYDSPNIVIQLCQQRLPSYDKLSRPTRTETYQALANLVRLDPHTLHRATVYRFAHVLDNPRSESNLITLPGGQAVKLAPASQSRDIFNENDVQYCPSAYRNKPIIGSCGCPEQ